MINVSVKESFLKELYDSESNSLTINCEDGKTLVFVKDSEKFSDGHKRKPDEDGVASSNIEFDKLDYNIVIFMDKQCYKEKTLLVSGRILYKDKNIDKYILSIDRDDIVLNIVPDDIEKYKSIIEKVNSINIRIPRAGTLGFDVVSGGYGYGFSKYNTYQDDLYYYGRYGDNTYYDEREGIDEDYLARDESEWYGLYMSKQDNIDAAYAVGIANAWKEGDQVNLIFSPHSCEFNKYCGFDHLKNAISGITAPEDLDLEYILDVVSDLTDDIYREIYSTKSSCKKSTFEFLKDTASLVENKLQDLLGAVEWNRLSRETINRYIRDITKYINILTNIWVMVVYNNNSLKKEGDKNAGENKKPEDKKPENKKSK